VHFGFCASHGHVWLCRFPLHCNNITHARRCAGCAFAVGSLQCWSLQSSYGDLVLAAYTCS
jgi:hypothetical protein